MVKKGLIFELQKLSTEDGPGIRTTVFMKHCPLNCAWCHNPESIPKKPLLEWLKHKCIGCEICVETCKQHALSFNKNGLQIDREKCISCGECVEECPSTALHMFGTWWNLEDLFHEINKDRVYYSKSSGGITVSGGEPTLQPEFVRVLLKKCQENGISTALDTCGFASKETYQKLLPYVDLILLDIKEIDEQKHKDYTGVSNKKILDNAKWLANYVKEHNKKLWIRTPLIPNYTARDANILGIAEFIAQKLNNQIQRWDLLTFNNMAKAKYKRLGKSWPLEQTELIPERAMQHYSQIADAVDIPMLIYNLPARTGVHIQAETVSRLAEASPNIVGIKDSSGDFNHILRYIEETREDFSVLSGEDMLILWTLMAGGQGGITGIANIYPETLASIYDLWKTGDLKAAREAQACIRPICDCLRLGNPNSIIKRAVLLLGENVGPVREPFNLDDPGIDRELLDVMTGHQLS